MAPNDLFYVLDTIDLSLKFGTLLFLENYSFENLFPFFSSGLLYFDAPHIPHFQCALSSVIIFKSPRKVLET